MAQKIRWGILGCGYIANEFAGDLKMLPDVEITAAASKSAVKAEEFASKFGVPYYYTDYEALVKNPEVDAVYVATTHNSHYENVMLCLENNKHVLCEKAFTVNSDQAEKIIRLARQKKLFLMEAMWTRFLPGIIELNRLLSEKMIGDVRFMTAIFGTRFQWNAESRLFKPELAGGALLDIGIYPVAFASMIFGKQPESIKSFASLGESGVDEDVSCLFEYEGGKKAMLFFSFSVTTPHEATIAGTKGYIKIPDFFHPVKMIIKLEGEGEKLVECPYEFTGYGYEAAEVCRCIREGRQESELMPLDETLRLMKTMDVLRCEWGVKYPGE